MWGCDIPWFSCESWMTVFWCLLPSSFPWILRHELGSPGLCGKWGFLSPLPRRVFLNKSLSSKMIHQWKKNHIFEALNLMLNICKLFQKNVIKILPYFYDTRMALTLIPESDRYAKQTKLHSSNPQEIESKTLSSISIWLMNTENKWCVYLRNKLSPHENFDSTKNCYTRWKASTKPMFWF